MKLIPKQVSVNVSAKAYGFIDGLSTGNEVGVVFDIPEGVSLVEAMGELDQIKKILEIQAWNHEMKKAGSNNLRVLVNGMVQRLSVDKATKQQDEAGEDQ